MTFNDNFCVRDFAIDLIQESYADDWLLEPIPSNVDLEELLNGHDGQSEFTDEPTTSTTKKLEINCRKVGRPKKSLLLNYGCHMCEYVAQSHFNLQRHINRIHIRKYTFECVECNRRFKEADTLKQHREEVHRLNLKTLASCQFCSRTFKRNFDLRRHVSVVHSHDREFLCPFCVTSFKTHFNCMRHIRSRCKLSPKS
ncbi:hypothetical protein M3Y95_00211000 [Aphelenchoides besseyi]|nr:hypothetical protein M3Y95_00211000 [Aphelenchoides besseyi]